MMYFCDIYINFIETQVNLFALHQQGDAVQFIFNDFIEG